ncbi:MAG: recombinase family protein [Actinomycetota bacterium]|nr:recombinase family protein [Actinomycetota bacterium]
MRVATYTRISTDEDHQPYSLASQTERLGAYVTSQPGWERRKEFTDQMSGATLERPGLERALAEAKAGRFDLLLVYRVDRLARTVRGLAQILDELDRAGVAFRSATEPFDTSTPAGRMMVQMLGVFAEFERATLVDRVIAGMERKASTGAWPGGFRPFGYVPDPATGFLVVKEDEAPVVALIFALYANKRLGSRAIANELNRRGHKTRLGKPWSHTSVLTVLTNRSYIGEIFFRGHYHKAPHPPLVDEDIFTTAQAILEERGDNPSVRRSNSSDYLLTGLIVCDRCGKRFVGAAAHGNKYRYPYYVCFSRQRYGTHECPQDRLRAEEMEERLIESLVKTLQRTDVLEEAVSRWAAQQGKDKPKLEKELAAADRQIRKAESALDRYFNAFESGSMTEATCASRVQKLAAEIAALGARRNELADELSDAAPDVPDENDLVELREELLSALEAGDHAQRKALLATLVAEIRVKDRSWIQPIFRVPIFRPPSGLVAPAGFEPAIYTLRG